MLLLDPVGTNLGRCSLFDVSPDETIIKLDLAYSDSQGVTSFMIKSSKGKSLTIGPQTGTTHEWTFDTDFELVGF